MNRIRRLTGNHHAEFPLTGVLLINLWAGLLFFAAFSAAVH
jgi:hypothetical protein